MIQIKRFLRTAGLVAVGALALFVICRWFYLSPTPGESDALRFIANRIQRTGIDAELNMTLKELSESTPIYIAEVRPGEPVRQARIVAANFTGAIGIDLRAFWDQQSRWYVSSGPIPAPSGGSYMVYITR